MLAAIRDTLYEDDKADTEEQIPDSVRQSTAIVDLLQTLDGDQLNAIYKELRPMVTVPRRKKAY